MIRHREAWAEEMLAPTRAAWAEQEAEHAECQAKPERRIVGAPAKAAPAALTLNTKDMPRDMLIVVSKLKAYVRARAGMNTSDGAVEVLSDIVRELCDGAMKKAASDGRKTVMERDF